MEEFSQMGGDTTTTTNRRVEFVYAPSSSPFPSTVAPLSSLNGRIFTTKTTPPMSTMQQQQQQHNHPLPSHPFQNLFDSSIFPSVKLEGGSSQQQPEIHYPLGRRGGGGGVGSSSSTTVDVDAIKAKIISHPQYSSLLEAYMDCQKVGAPPEVVAKLTAAAQDFETRQRLAVSDREPSATDPELDQFMEAYYDMLVKYRDELSRPMQEAMDFLRRVESQLGVLTNGSARVFSLDEKCEGVGSSEEDQDGSGGETELPELDPRAEDRDLKHHLLKKYSGYLGSLKQELSKKRKKGKLPKEARQKLLTWWELHLKWPYPSETEKVALAESTGLDQKQINNWFINQRKRHWKPADDMQFIMMDGFRPHNTAALYMDGRRHVMGDGSNRFGP